MINDGFGDDLTYAEYIESNERLLHMQAAERHVRPEFWDDVLQEGRIVQWEVLRKRPDAPRAYVHVAMGHRMTETASRQTWTGYESRHGRPTDPIRRRDRDSFDDPAFIVEATAPEVLDTVLEAYHAGEIAQALDALSPRQRAYVVLRFVYGFTVPEIAKELQTSKATLEREWRTQTKPVLGTKLQHLTSVT